MHPHLDRERDPGRGKGDCRDSNLAGFFWMGSPPAADRAIDFTTTTPRGQRVRSASHLGFGRLSGGKSGSIKYLI